VNKDNSTPKVWVGCLAAYNRGDLHGEWIDATQDAEDIDNDIQSILKDSPVPNAEEADIFDTDEMFGLSPASCRGEDIARIGAFIEEHGELGAKLVSHLGGFDEAAEALSERHYGVYDDLASFAEELCEDLVKEMPTALQGYIDFAAYGRDMELGGDIFTIRTDDGLAVFWN